MIPIVRINPKRSRFAQEDSHGPDYWCEYYGRENCDRFSRLADEEADLADEDYETDYAEEDDQEGAEEDDTEIAEWSKEDVEELFFALYPALSEEDFLELWEDTVGDD